jgi:hypothetical protein
MLTRESADRLFGENRDHACACSACETWIWPDRRLREVGRGSAPWSSGKTFP